MENSLREKLKNIKAAVFDADGVLFTGSVFMHPETGEMLKERSHIDGHGLSLLRKAGIKIAFVTGEQSRFLEMVCKKFNTLGSSEDGTKNEIVFFTGQERENKVTVIDTWLKKQGLSWEETVAMGDDLPDYELLQRASVAVAPAQAELPIKNIADHITERKGGAGAIRDLCNLIFEAKGVDIISLRK